MIKKLKIPAHFSYFLSIYGFSLLFYLFFRLLLVGLTWEYASGVPQKWAYTFKALLMGVVFDTLVSFTIMFFPFVIYSVLRTFSLKNTWILRGVHYTMMLIFSASFLLCSADIPFFSFFYSRLNAVVFDWADTSGITFSIVGGYWYFFLLYGAICWFFIWLCGKSLKKYVLTDQNANPYFSKLSAFTSFGLVALLIFTFVKRVESTNNFDVNAVNFSEYAYPNQITLNPAYTFTKSLYTIKKDPDVFKFKMMQEDTAINIVRRQLGLEGEWLNGSPLARKVSFDSPPQYHNVVLVLMESMSGHYLSRFNYLPQENGQPLSLTPFLDSLSEQSIFFDNFFSSGVHTSNGIYSTLTGYPIIPGQHPLQRNPEEKYNNLPQILRGQGYQTTFFFTHDKRFDNMSAFLSNNGYDQQYSEESYPKADIGNTWGVPDHKMLNFALPKINDMAAKGKPFFTTLLTVSHHAPFFLPKDIKINYKSQKVEHQIVEYSDWALRNFMEQASKQAWYDNTIFVFVADHGIMTGVNHYDLPLSMTHIPLFIYAPKLVKSEVKKSVGGQIDVSETILGLLHIPHVNNTFGIDLLRGEREAIFFQNDSKLGAADTTHFSIYRLSANQQGLYKYQERSVENIAPEEKERALYFERLSKAAPQTAQWMIKNGKTGVK